MTVDLAEARTATATVPAHCEVTAHLDAPGIDGAPADRIGFRLELPDAAWNGRFLMIGGGGFDGGYGTFADGFHGLSRGYATAATDTGHDGGDTASWALHEPTKVADFGYRAVHLVRDASVAILGGWAGRPVERSIFAGCSTGGRMALMAAQRYPADFQGVIAGAPAWDYDGLMMEFAWDEQALLRDQDHYIPAGKLPMIQAAEVGQCAASGAVAGGIINDPPRCRFDAKALLCKAEDAPDCLTAGQVDTLQRLHAGPRDAHGLSLYPGLPVGSEDAGNWPVWVTGTKAPELAGGGLGVAQPDAPRSAYLKQGWPNQLFFAEQYMRYMFFPMDAQDPARSAMAFDFDRYPQRCFSLAATQDPTPDLRAFQALGGKLIVYGGWGDPVVPLPRTIEYMRGVWAMAGGKAQADRFSRLYTVPGMPHCGGGAVPNAFGQPYVVAPPGDASHDVTAALERWIDTGAAPGPIVATQYLGNDPAGGVQRARPVCAYPAVAAYVGGDPDAPGSYTCR